MVITVTVLFNMKYDYITSDYEFIYAQGLNCELTVDVCVPNPCQNNATCTNHYTNYTCTCTEDYTGNNCETLVPTSTVTSTSTVQSNV